MICTRQRAAEASNNATTNSTNNNNNNNRKRQQRPRMAHVPYQFTDDDYRNRKIRNLILCTKAYQAEDAIEGIKNRLLDTTTSSNTNNYLRIFVLCNGALDVREKLRKALIQQSPISESNLDLIMCTTTHGVINETSSTLTPTVDDGRSIEDVVEDDGDDDMFHLRHIGVGKAYVGNTDKFCTKSIAQLFDQSGLNTHSLSKSQMEVLLWSKLTANCVLNPLTSLYDLPNGRLVEIPGFDALRKQIVEEVSKVAIEMNPEMKNELSIQSLDRFVEQVVQENLQNKSSMYHDIRKGRRTEVDNLNGYIVRKITELGLSHSAPANEELLCRIHELTVDRS
jgi:2-dehydropantoate 2-reductase